MPKVKIYSVEGKESGEKDLREDIFGVEVNPELVHEVMVGISANLRRPYAHTKTRSDVSGGGKKPWKQKGTGRARHGSTRSPIWVGGGVTFGPRKDRDYSLKINRKTKQRAMKMVLSDLVKENHLVLVDSFNVKDGKTKEFSSLLSKLPIDKKVVVVSPEKNEMLRRSTGNLSDVTFRNVGDFGFMDALSTEYVLMTPEAVDQLEKKFVANKA